MRKFVSEIDFKKAARESASSKTDLALRKAFIAEVKAEGEKDEDPIVFAISSSVVDRANDTVDVNGWELSNYQKNPVVLWAHDGYQPPIGKALSLWTEEQKLKSRATFTPKDLNPFGHMVGRMVRGGFLNAVSVGFAPLEYKVADDRDDGDSWWAPLDFTKQELLEYSVVPIPANPEALVEARSAGVDLAPMIEWAEKVLDGVASPLERKRAEEVRRSAGGEKKYFLASDAASLEARLARIERSQGALAGEIGKLAKQQLAPAPEKKGMSRDELIALVKTTTTAALADARMKISGRID